MSIKIGLTAEEIAYQYLQKQGLKPLARNFRCQYGEIDLIMREADSIVFIEVRYRKNQRYGGAIYSVQKEKQRRLIAAAHYFLQKQPWMMQSACRFDVVGLTQIDELALIKTEAITWIKNAFSEP